MPKKTLTLLSFIFFTQFLTSCFDDCNCSKGQKLNASFQELSINTARTYLEEDSVTILSSFMVSLNLRGIAEQVLVNNQMGIHFGFSQANACDCVPPYTYTYSNSVDSVKIILKSLENNIDVSEWFYADYGNYSIPITQYFQQQEKPFKYYELEMYLPFTLDSVKLPLLPQKFNLEVNLFHEGKVTLSDTVMVDFITSEN